MRFIKLFFLSVVVLGCFVTCFSLLIPPNLHIARNEEISSSRDRILSVVSDIHTWQKWNRMVNDSVLTHLNISADGLSASSDQLDISLKKDSVGGILMRWKKANGNEIAGGFKILDLQTAGNTVQWYFDFHFKWYPWQKFASLVYDRQFQPVMEESLSNLKQLIENNP